MLKFDCLTSLRHLFLFGLAQDLRLHARQRGKMLACLQHHQHPSAGRVGPAVLMRRGNFTGADKEGKVEKGKKRWDLVVRRGTGLAFLRTTKQNAHAFKKTISVV